MIELEATDEGGTMTYADLADGEPVDPGWLLDDGGIACASAKNRARFAGHNLFFSIHIPEESQLKAWVNADDLQPAIYTYSIFPGEEPTLPPDVSSLYNCYSSTEPDVQPAEITALLVPLDVIIGVTGGEGVVEGGFTLTVVVTQH